MKLGPGQRRHDPYAAERTAQRHHRQTLDIMLRNHQRLLSEQIDRGQEHRRRLVDQRDALQWALVHTQDMYPEPEIRSHHD